MSKRSRLYPAALSLVLIPLAAAPSLADTSAPTRLAPTLVTATRTAQSVDETLASVTVITREEIAQGQYRDLPQLLNSVPGVQIGQSGGAGKLTDVFMRGTTAKHVLVLIDGIKLGSVTSGQAAFEHLPLDQVERIEIVRGPRSTLYGSEAVGGIVQIFTRKGQDGVGGDVTVGGGSHRTHFGNASIYGGNGASHLFVGVSERYTKGFDAMRNNNEPDSDGYSQKSITLRTGHRFSVGNEIEASFLRSEGENSYDDGWTNPLWKYADNNDSVQQVATLGAVISPTTYWRINGRFGQSQDHLTFFDGGNFKDKTKSERQMLSLQNDIVIRGSDTLTLGLDYQDDQVESTTNYDRSSRDNKGYFAQYQFEEGIHQLLFGVRRDDNEQFGNHTTWNTGYGLALPFDLHLTVNYGTSFRAPTFVDLHTPWGGDPNLKPETAKSYEMGLRQNFARSYWSASGYRTEFTDMIVSDALWKMKNIGKAQINGYELAAGYTVNQNFSIDGAVELLDPKDKNTGNVLPRRAKRTGTFNLNANYGQFSSTFTIQGVGERYDNAANTLKLPGYTLAHLRGEYTITPEWSVQAKIENLFDKEYEAIATYNTPGRSAYLSTSYRF